MNKKVLIVDDSLTQLSSLKIMFKREGWDVECANNGVEGYIKTFCTAPDLIVSDVMMPNLTGFQLTRLLKNDPKSRKIPVILLTVLDKKLDNFWGSQCGADRFVLKNMDFSELLKVAKELTDAQTLSEEDKALLTTCDINQNNIIEKINKILDDALMKATIVNEFRSLSELSTKEIPFVKKIFSIFRSIIDYKVCAIYFNAPGMRDGRTLFLDAVDANLSPEICNEIKNEFFKTVDKDANEPEQNDKWDILTPHVENAPVLNFKESLITKYIVPFEYEDGLMGAVCLYDTEARDYSHDAFYETIKKELELLMKLKILYARTQYLSITDELTGLYNRRHFDDSLKREYERCKRYKTKMSVAMMDIDHFKQVNDTYGHQFGDFVLQEISKIILSSIRQTDLACRYGGEEICVIMPETMLENIYVPLERLRIKIENHDFTYEGKTVKMSISIGGASTGSCFGDYYDVVKKADSALYEAKENGRNRVIINNG